MIRIPKGTKDVLPLESAKWHFVEANVRDLARVYNINEIRTPTFEHTELFLRGVGDTTDIVNKEMYTFLDKGDRSITLKPEGTAGVARAFIENALENAMSFPVKMYYMTPVFRYERPQAGRLREHHQFGVELYGSPSPEADFEAISIARDMLQRMQVKNVALSINSIGCPVCRQRYNEALKAYLADHLSSMCKVCAERFDKNPLRILDCKEEGCKAINANAPKITDYICDDCRAHMDALEACLAAAGIPYTVDPGIVRGLDYYTRTVFEFITETEDGKLTVCGGGRYDGLVEDVGGKHTPAVGFGMGIERLLAVSGNADEAKPNAPTVFFATLGEAGQKEAFRLTAEVRAKGVSAEKDLMGRSLKAQMKYANKVGAKYVVVLGEDEIATGTADLKNMLDGTAVKVKLNEITEILKNEK